MRDGRRGLALRWPAGVPGCKSPGPLLKRQFRRMPPGEGIPAKYVAFSGIWGGQLDGMYDGKLAVLTISRGGNVTATYAWGDVADNKPGVADGEGKIFGNTLKLRRLPNGGDVSAVMISTWSGSRPTSATRALMSR